MEKEISIGGEHKLTDQSDINKFRDAILSSESLTDFSKKLIVFSIENSSEFTKTSLIAVNHLSAKLIRQMESSQFTVIYNYFNCMSRALDIECSYRTLATGSDWITVAIICSGEITPEEEIPIKIDFSEIDCIDLGQYPEYRPGCWA